LEPCGLEGSQALATTPTMRLHPRARGVWDCFVQGTLMTKSFERLGAQAALVMSITFVMAIVLALF